LTEIEKIQLQTFH